MTFEQDIWRDGLSWPNLGQVSRSRLQVKVHD